MSEVRALPARGRSRVMGVLNVTPDSFSDGGRHVTVEGAVDAARRMQAQGAAVLDLGAVSTRPGAEPVDPEREWDRLAPVWEAVRAATTLPMSVDTTCASVLARVLELGVEMLNDTSALADDPELAPLAAEAALDVVLMHRRGTPRTMQDAPHYDDAPVEVRAELCAALCRASAAGIRAERVWFDPGFGFGKRLEDNLALLAGLPELVALGQRVVLGCSRKSFLGALTGREVDAREHATTATTVLGALAGVDLFRVHDVAAAVDALAIVEAVTLGEGRPRRIP